MINVDYLYVPIASGLSTYVILWILKNVIVGRLKKISLNTETFVDDVILGTLESTKSFFMIGVSLYVSYHTSHIEKYSKLANNLFVVLVGIQVVIWGKKAIDTWFEQALKAKGDDPSLKTSFNFLALILKLAFIVTVTLFSLNNLGVDVTTFVAGLGVGGIAIALATQNILGDLFSSLSIVLDKPFVIGDSISLGEWQGTIEHIGLKTTRVRSINGEQIVISNSDLLNSKIRNFKRMNERRVNFQLGLTYEGPREKLKLVPEVIEKIVRSEADTRFDRAHFIRYGASSLDFDIVYWMTTPEYIVFADTHQRILYAIGEEIEKLGLEFAYPTQSIFVTSKAKLAEV